MKKQLTIVVGSKVVRKDNYHKHDVEQHLTVNKEYEVESIDVENGKIQLKGFIPLVRKHMVKQVK